MIKFVFALVAILALPALAQLTVDKGALKPEEQKYYKNDANAGKSHYERIDSTVREINSLHAKINSLEADVAKLKEEVKELKEKNK